MLLQRRSVLSGLAAASVCPICLARGAAAEPAPAAPGEKSWDYEGEGGPSDWGQLKPEFKSCTIGTQQSPINLAKPVHADIAKLKVDWQSFSMTVVNLGHTAQVVVPAGSSITEGDAKYNLAQFHFHHPSEHLVDGSAMAMEVHFVHLNEKKDAALVVGIFIVEGAANTILGQIFSSIPKEKGENKTTLTVDPSKLLPAKLDRYRYEGSLTTPPCSEIVHWNVLRAPITASADQLKIFAALFSNNARPILPLNRRFLLEG